MNSFGFSFGFPQDRYPPHHLGGGGEQGAAGKNVGIEVFAHGAFGKEAVLAAFLSNSVLLVMRIGAEGLRSWLLDWPVAGKARIKSKIMRILERLLAI